jgi:D-tyrosyl-tRNA(Tyr) deacylase
VRAIVQRVSRASVTVDGRVSGAIDAGFVVLLGVAPDDTVAGASWLAGKIAALRVFTDDNGRMSRSLADVGGAVLSVSQFTLYADLRRGNRPSFTDAAAPPIAEPLYDAFCRAIEAMGLRCERGIFGAHMEVALTNDGPVTIILDTADRDRPRRA